MSCRVYHLGSGGSPHAGARQLALLQPHWPGHRLGTLRPCSLNTGHDCFRLRTATDIKTLYGIRQAILKFQPDLVCAWGENAVLTAMALRVGPIVGVNVDRTRNSMVRFVLRRLKYVLAVGQAEQARYISLGFSEAQIKQLPPARPSFSPAPRAKTCAGLDLPENAKIIVAVGRMESSSGLLDALKTFNLLHYADRDLYMVLVGDGPMRERFNRFAHGVDSVAQRVRFVCATSRVQDYLALACAVWVTSKIGNANIIREALALSRPVLAYDTADAREWIPPEHTGNLIPLGDRVALAQRTLRDLHNSPCQVALQDPGNEISVVANSWQAVYDSVIV